MRKPLLPSLFVLLCLLLTQCDWFSQKNSPTPADDLPPATQEGKNTFGCRVNGKTWIPKGFNGTLNLAPVYEYPIFNLATFNLATYRLEDDDIRQSLSFGVDSLTAPGTYLLNEIGKRAVRFYDGRTKCEYNARNGDTQMSGTLTITKFDLKPGQRGIVLGTFEFTLINPSCPTDTIRVTDGRFDVKI